MKEHFKNPDSKATTSSKPLSYQWNCSNCRKSEEQASQVHIGVQGLRVAGIGGIRSENSTLDLDSSRQDEQGSRV